MLLWHSITAFVVSNNFFFELEQVAKIKKKFEEILECYRHQHPAQSHIYRSVLCSKHRQGCGSSSNGTSNTSSPVPSDTDARGGIIIVIIILPFDVLVLATGSVIIPSMQRAFKPCP